MAKSIRLETKLGWNNPEAIQAQRTIDECLSGNGKEILKRLYFLGPHHLYDTSINDFSKLEAFGLVQMDGRIAFLTTAGSRFCIIGGYQDQKDTWHRNKELVRKRELKEMYIVLGVRPERNEDEDGELPSIRG